ncbi:MAG: DNA polymerase III subunit delta [Alphaproteobacteria bacterium]|nr:DNA polymerase III subunit delta [Alphaproteobacteria bacterium]
MAQKKAAEVAAYLRGFSPDKAPLLILVYGGDSGGVYGIAQSLRRLWLGGLGGVGGLGEQSNHKETDEDLQYIALSQEMMAQSGACLCDEAASIGLFGGRRFIHVPSTIMAATLTNNVRYLLDSLDVQDAQQDTETETETGEQNALVVIEAGALTPASALRKMVEKHAHAMTLPCFALEPKDVAIQSRGWLKQEGFEIEASALNVLAERLAGDRGIMQRALERLVLYKGGAKDESKLIQIDDVEILFGLSEQTNISVLADAIGLGATNKMDTLLAQLSSLGQPPQSCLIPVRMHFQNLHLIVGLCEAGTNINQALGAVRPPLHFSRKDSVKAQIKLWTSAKIERALTILYEAEKESRAGLPSGLTASVVARSFLRVSSAARR